MVGVIADKHVLLKLGLIFREFGLCCAARSLRAVCTRQRTTFLDIAFKTERSRRKKFAGVRRHRSRN